MNPNSRARRRFLIPRLRTVTAIGLAVALALGYIAREPLLIRLARILTVDDAEGPADYLVVLGGGAETRPFAAAALYRAGVAPKVLVFEHEADRITGLGLAPTHDELYRKILQIEGVPARALDRAPGVVRNSWDEARALRRFLVARPVRRIVLVTSAEHTRRARWVFRKVLTGLPVEVRVAPARHWRFDETNWWKSDEGALVYLHEYLKLPSYWIMSLLPLDHGAPAPAR